MDYDKELEIEEDIIEQSIESEYRKDNKNDDKEAISNFPRIFFAGFRIRFIAYMIDSLSIWAISRLTINPLMNHFDIWYDSDIIGIVITILYFSLLTYFTNGYTIGKMICSIRVVEEGKERIEITTVIVREVFGRFILERLPILYLMVIITKNRQHISDILTDTYVISEKSFEAMNFKNILKGGNIYEV